jgi:hypothetical protein
MTERIQITWDVVLAVLLLLAGVVLLTDRLDISALADMFRYWPAALICLGVVKLLEAAERPSAGP